MDSVWIWQQPEWPLFRWNNSALEPLLREAHAARNTLLAELQALDAPLDREAISALMSRESLGTAAIEGEQLDPAQVRSSISRRLLLPVTKAQAQTTAQVEGLSLRKAVSLTRVSRATAWLDLADLVEKQAIEPSGSGRSRSYRIRWPDSI